MRFSDWLHQQTRRTDSIALARLMKLVFEHLTRERGLAPGAVAAVMAADNQRAGRRDTPACLQPHLPGTPSAAQPPTRRAALRRQARHQSAGLPTAAEMP